MMCSVEHDDEITSEELDDLLDDAPALDADRPQGQTEVRLTVVVDAETLHELELRAASEGTDLNAAAGGALRAGAHAAGATASTPQRVGLGRKVEDDALSPE